MRSTNVDWQTIVKQQEELEKSFSALRMIFEQAEKDFKARSNVFIGAMAQQQAQDAQHLTKIHQALMQIIESNNSVKQNQPS
jgi:cytochrome c556